MTIRSNDVNIYANYGCLWRDNLKTITFTDHKKRRYLQAFLILCFITVLTGCSRDLSTPSNRLVGHWVNANETHHYFGPIDPKTETGTYIEYAIGVTSYYDYWIISESIDGTKIIIDIFSDEYPQCLDFTITKDGIIKDGYGGVFAYVDDKIKP